LLNDLRDALEHMDEALFEDGEPVPDISKKRKKWVLDRVPRMPAAGATSRAGELPALGLVSVDGLERTARKVANSIEEETQAAAVDRMVQEEIEAHSESELLERPEGPRQPAFRSVHRLAYSRAAVEAGLEVVLLASTVGPVIVGGIWSAGSHRRALA
jgi:hypothetical protein